MPRRGQLERESPFKENCYYFCLLFKYTDFFLNGPLKGNSYHQGAGFQVIFYSFFVLLYYFNLSVLLKQ